MDAIEKYPSYLLLIGLLSVFLWLHLHLFNNVHMGLGPGVSAPVKQTLHIRIDPQPRQEINSLKPAESKRPKKVSRSEKQAKTIPDSKPLKMINQQERKIVYKAEKPDLTVYPQMKVLLAKTDNGKITPKIPDIYANGVVEKKEKPIEEKSEKMEESQKKVKAEKVLPITNKTAISDEEMLPLSVIRELPEPTIQSAQQSKASKESDDVLAKPDVDWNQLLKQFISQIDVSDYYPALSRRRRQQGVVVLNLVLEGNMELTSISIKKTSQYPRLDKAALALMEENRKNLKKILGLNPVLLENPISLHLPVHFALK
ncbi:TonB family protein [bacterium]|nr:TonB family protein [bacterium]